MKGREDKQCNPCNCNPCDCNPCDCNPCDCNPCDCNPCDCNPCDCNPCDCNPCDCGAWFIISPLLSGVDSMSGHIILKRIIRGAYASQRPQLHSDDCIRMGVTIWGTQRVIWLGVIRRAEGPGLHIYDKCQGPYGYICKITPYLITYYSHTNFSKI